MYTEKEDVRTRRPQECRYEFCCDETFYKRLHKYAEDNQISIAKVIKRVMHEYLGQMGF